MRRHQVHTDVTEMLRIHRGKARKPIGLLVVLLVLLVPSRQHWTVVVSQTHRLRVLTQSTAGLAAICIARSRANSYRSVASQEVTKRVVRSSKLH